MLAQAPPESTALAIIGGENDMLRLAFGVRPDETAATFFNNGKLLAIVEMLRLERDDAPVAEEFPFVREDRKSTRLNSSHVASSYAVFCLKKKTGEECMIIGLSHQRNG